MLPKHFVLNKSRILKYYVDCNINNEILVYMFKPSLVCSVILSK